MASNWSLGFRQGVCCKKNKMNKKKAKSGVWPPQKSISCENEKRFVAFSTNFLDEIIQEERISLSSTSYKLTHILLRVSLQINYAFQITENRCVRICKYSKIHYVREQ